MQRDVVKWIQSLDLSFPLKNPRRDIANGFLIAEILSRYDKDIPMHGIDTGMALHKRLDNWNQIRRFLGKMKCNTISPQLTEDTMQQRDGAGRQLLELLYTFLTRRELKQVALEGSRVAGDLSLPNYARSTASKKLRDANDETKARFAKLTGQTDEVKLRTVNEALLETHYVQRQAFKITEPERYTYDPNADRSPPPTDAHSDRKQGRSRQKLQIARSMAVKGIEGGVVETLLRRDAEEREEAFRAGFDLAVDLGSSLSRVVALPLNRFGLLEFLDGTAAQSGRTSAGSEGWRDTSVGGDYFHKFIANRAALRHDVKDAVWGALLDAANNTAKLVAHRQEEVTHLLVGLGFLLAKASVVRDGGDDSTASAALLVDGATTSGYDRQRASAFFGAIGANLAKLSQDAARRVLSHHVLPAFAPALALAAPGCLHELVGILCCFSGTNHLEDVKHLVSLLQQQLDVECPPGVARERLTLCLALVFSNVDFAYCFGGDAFCQYYAITALTSPSSLVRGCGVHMLALLVSSAMELVVAVLPKLLALADDGNSDWELRILLMELLSKGAHRLEAASASAAEGFQFEGAEEEAAATNDTPRRRETLVKAATETLPRLRSAIRVLFDSFSRSPQAQRHLSLRIVAPFIDDNDVGLGSAFIQQLLTFDDATRGALLHPSSATSQGNGVEALPGRVRSLYVCGAIGEVWNGLGVAFALIREHTKMSTFDLLSILEPLVLTSDLVGRRESWMSVAAALKEELFTAIFDPAKVRGVTEADLPLCAEMAFSVTTKYYADLSGETIDESTATFSEIQQHGVEWLQANT